MAIKVGPFAEPGCDALLDWPLEATTTKLVFSFPSLLSGSSIVVCRTADTQGTVDVGVGSPRDAAWWYFNTNVREAMLENPHHPYWCAPNEPVFPWEQYMNWYAQFLYEFAKILYSFGRRAVIGEFSVGCPTLASWRFYGPALKAIHELGALQGVHGYGPLNRYYTLKFEADEIEFQKLGFYNTPVIITECGAESLPEVGWQPWKKQFGDIQTYFDQYIAPLARYLHNIRYCAGAHLFCEGTNQDSRWDDYNVAFQGLPQMMVNLSRELGPAPPMEKPRMLIPRFIFKTPLQIILPAGMSAEIYDKPFGKLRRVLMASKAEDYLMDVYEVRGVWFKVYPKPGRSGLDMWVAYMG